MHTVECGDIVVYCSIVKVSHGEAWLLVLLWFHEQCGIQHVLNFHPKRRWGTLVSEWTFFMVKHWMVVLAATVYLYKSIYTLLLFHLFHSFRMHASLYVDSLHPQIYGWVIYTFQTLLNCLNFYMPGSLLINFIFLLIALSFSRASLWILLNLICLHDYRSCQEVLFISKVFSALSCPFVRLWFFSLMDWALCSYVILFRTNVHGRACGIKDIKF